MKFNINNRIKNELKSKIELIRFSHGEIFEFFVFFFSKKFDQLNKIHHFHHLNASYSVKVRFDSIEFLQKNPTKKVRQSYLI